MVSSSRTLNSSYNQQIAKVGFPFVCENILIGIDIELNPETLLRAYGSLLEDTRYTRFHQFLSQYIYYVINVGARQIIHLTQEDFVWLTKYEGSTDWMSIEVIYSCWKAFEESDFVDFVDKIGRRSNKFYSLGRYDYREVFGVLSRAFVENPHRLGVLRVLANLCTHHGLRTQIPTELLEANLTEAKYSIAQFILRLVQEGHSNTKLELMALELVNLSEDRPESIDEVLTTIRQHKMIDNKTQHFLLSLCAELKRRGNHIGLQSAIAAIEHILSQIRSNLVASWSVLELPENLDKLLTV